jgi:hypothetical protein
MHCSLSSTETVSLPWEAIHLRSHLAMHRVRAHRPRLVVAVRYLHRRCWIVAVCYLHRRC